jgi:WD40 repeat protein
LLGGKGGNGGRLFDFLVYDPAVATAEGYGDERQPVTPQYMRSAAKKLLRRSLRNHLHDNNVSTERLMTVEYAPSLPRPTGGGAAEVPDWVGSVAGAQLPSSGSGQRLFVAGCYDGQLRLFDGVSASPVGSGVRGHEGAIKAVASAGSLVVSGGADKALRVWRLTSGGGGGSSPSLVPLGVGESGGASRLAHENSVECVAAR